MPLQVVGSRGSPFRLPLSSLSAASTIWATAVAARPERAMVAILRSMPRVHEQERPPDADDRVPSEHQHARGIHGLGLARFVHVDRKLADARQEYAYDGEMSSGTNPWPVEFICRLQCRHHEGR